MKPRPSSNRLDGTVESIDDKPTEHSQAIEADDQGLELDPAPAIPLASSPSFKHADDPAVWHLARSGGQQTGPITLGSLKEQLSAGSLLPTDLLWKQGLPEWLPAREIPELAEACSALQPMPSLPKNAFVKNVELLRHVNAILADSSFYRITGRLCLGLSAFIFLLSALLSFWQYTWFTGAVLFFAIGITSEASGHILEALFRIETKVANGGKSEQGSSDHD